MSKLTEQQENYIESRIDQSIINNAIKDAEKGEINLPYKEDTISNNIDRGLMAIITGGISELAIDREKAEQQSSANDLYKATQDKINSKK